MNLEFVELERRIVECRRCPRLVEWREEVAQKKTRRFRTQQYWGRPVPAFGSPDAALLIIGLAPAAHGGNRTGRMFTGDRSGDWLYEALYRFGFANQPKSVSMDDGLRVHNCLVTAVIRCAPPDNKPLPEEVERCRDYVCRELQLASRKRVVVTLGRIAFEAFLKTRLIAGEPPAPGEADVLSRRGMGVAREDYADYVLSPKPAEYADREADATDVLSDF